MEPRAAFPEFSSPQKVEMQKKKKKKVQMLNNNEVYNTKTIVKN